MERSTRHYRSLVCVMRHSIRRAFFEKTGGWCSGYQPAYLSGYDTRMIVDKQACMAVTTSKAAQQISQDDQEETRATPRLHCHEIVGSRGSTHAFFFESRMIDSVGKEPLSNEQPPLKSAEGASRPGPYQLDCVATHCLKYQ